MKKIMSINEFLNEKTHSSLYLTLGAASEGDGAIKTIKEFCETTGDFFKGASRIMYYSLHPKELLGMMWTALVTNSFEIFLLLCLVAIMAWLIGWEKGKKIAAGSILTYGVIQALNAGLR